MISVPNHLQPLNGNNNFLNNQLPEFLIPEQSFSIYAIKDNSYFIIICHAYFGM